MTSRRSYRPVVEALERRELMAVGDDLLLSRPPSGEQRPMGPARPPPASELVFLVPPNANSSVVVEVVDGVMKIRGSAGADSIMLRGGDGTYTVETGINGLLVFASGLVTNRPTYTGVTAGVEIDLGDGDDAVFIYADNVPQLTITMGAGDDRVILRGPLPYYGDLLIARDYMPNPVVLLHVQGNLAIDTGAGKDLLQAATKVHGDALVQLGAGEDIYSPYSFVTSYFGLISTKFGELSATGNMTLDLGADQEGDPVPGTWQSDAKLARNLEFVVRYLDYYQNQVAAGNIVPGTPQIIAPAGLNTARVDAEGRLEVEFNFIPGYQRAIDLLLARGVTVDAYDLSAGVGRASLGSADLDRLANLPGLEYFGTVRREAVQIQYDARTQPWDYVRPGSASQVESDRPWWLDRTFETPMGPYPKR